MLGANKVRLSLDLSPSANSIIEEAAANQHTTKSEILRKAIALMKVVDDAKLKNQRVGIMASDGRVFSEIVGL